MVAKVLKFARQTTREEAVMAEKSSRNMQRYFLGLLINIKSQIHEGELLKACQINTRHTVN